MKTPQTLLFALFLGVCFTSHCEATVYVSDGSAQNVQYVHDNLAHDGDTITLPSGTFSWATGVTMTKIITLQGAGTGTGGGDQTVIIDNYASGSPLLTFQAGSNSVFRMTGITVKSGSGSIKDGGTVVINGPGNVRIDHCHLNVTSSANYKPLAIYNGVFGVLDHCIVDFTSGGAFLAMHNGRLGSGDIQGNYEWSLPTNFGSADYFFIEDNIITGGERAGTYDCPIFDGSTAAKVVVRFNTVYHAVMGETHATGHAGDDRGLRSQEVYGNYVTSDQQYYSNFAALSLYNGTTLVWGNSWDQVYKNIFRLQVVRMNADTYSQVATPGGWGYAGTAFNGTGSNWDGGTISGTDTVLGYPCIDQPGRGQGDLLTGVFPSKVNSTTGTIAWPNQALEPIYVWNNVGDIVPGWGGATYSDGSGGRVIANRDYYPSTTGIQTSPTSPFDGSSGTGWGTLANRPTTCTTGVAYFATDQGSWNTSTSNPYGVQQNGASGVLYKCTAPNTWTLHYAPYTYPHPLQGATPGPTPTATPTSTPTATASATSTPTPRATATSTPTPTPSPTASPTPTATATATPTPIATPTSTPTPTTTPIVPPGPVLCMVPNLIGAKINRAQSIWNAAGFTPPSSITMRGPNGRPITWESLPAGSFGACAGTAIAVQSF